MNGIATNQLTVSRTQTLVHTNTTPKGINTMSAYQTPEMVMQVPGTPGVLQGIQSFPASQHIPTPPMQPRQPLMFAQQVAHNTDISQARVQMQCTLGT